jgi:choline-sulfatase
MSDRNPPPNVVLVTVDCLRYDRCGFNGADKDTTRALDKLAGNSVVYDRAYAPGPRTAESVPGILTGLLSAECSYVSEKSYKSIPEETETVATFLGDRGYETVAVLSNPQLSRQRNFDLGFGTFENLRTGSGSNGQDDPADSGDSGSFIRDFGHAALDVFRRLPLPIDPAVVGTALYRTLEKRRGWSTVDGAEVVSRLLDRLPPESDGPFFAWTHLNDLHSPLHPERVRQGGLYDAGDFRQFRADARRIRHERSLGFEAMYDSAVRYVNRQVGRLLEVLSERADWNRTAVVLTADHGEALWDRGIYGHAAGNEQRLYEDDRDYMYRELLRVPLLVRRPDGDVSGRRSDRFSLLWLPSLIGAITGFEAGGFPRQPSADVTTGTDDEGQAPVVVADAITDEGHTVAVHGREGKVITDGTDPTGIRPENWHYFDGSDRGERVPAGDPPERLVEECEAVLADPDAVERADPSIGEETIERLESLGYK